MKELAQKFLPVLTGCLLTCYAHARLGDGLLVGEMFHFSDVVCAGRVTGYDFATLGQTSVWVVVEFTLDHAIKGNAATNIIGIMGYQLDGAVSTNEISRLLRQMKRTPRCLVFLRDVNVKERQYKLTDDLNGMLPACDKKPTFQESADEKARLSVELNRAYNELAVGERELLEIVAGDWLPSRTHSATPSNPKGFTP